MALQSQAGVKNAAAIGLRVKSGWAMAVLLAGPPGAPRVLDACVVELSDPAQPDLRQPYHGGTGQEERDGRKVQRRVTAIRRYARRALARLIKRYRTMDGALRGVAVVAGSDIAPERIGNPHIRAHAYEGQLFRTVVEDGARRARLSALRGLERNLYAQAANALDRPAPDLKRAIAAIDRPPGGSWRAEGKAAALAAWMVLVR
jgi:hypothetical protein